VAEHDHDAGETSLSGNANDDQTGFADGPIGTPNFVVVNKRQRGFGETDDEVV